MRDHTQCLTWVLGIQKSVPHACTARPFTHCVVSPAPGTDISRPKTSTFSFFMQALSPADFESYPSWIHRLTGCLISWYLLDSSITNLPLSPAWKGLIFHADGKFHPYAKSKAHLSSRAIGDFLEPMEITQATWCFGVPPHHDPCSRFSLPSLRITRCAESKPSPSMPSFTWTFCSLGNKIGSPSQRKHWESFWFCECI